MVLSRMHTSTKPRCFWQHPFNSPLSGTTEVSRYQKGKTNLDFTEARDSEWHWHQLGHMQVCILLQTDNHASTPPLSFFLQAGCPSWHPTMSMHWRHIVSGKQQLIPTLTLQNSNQLFFWHSLHIPQISQKSTHDFLSYPVIQAAEKQVAVKITSAATSSNRSNTF